MWPMRNQVIEYFIKIQLNLYVFFFETLIPRIKLVNSFGLSSASEC